MPWGPLFGAPGPDSGLHPSSLRRKENAYRRFLFLLRYAEPAVRFAHSSPVQITGAHQTKTPRLCLGGLCLARSTGFEPAISSVTGRHVRPLHHERKIIQLSYFSNYLQIFQPPNTSKLRTLWSRRWDCGPTTRKPPVVV